MEYFFVLKGKKGSCWEESVTLARYPVSYCYSELRTNLERENVIVCESGIPLRQSKIKDLFERFMPLIDKNHVDHEQIPDKTLCALLAKVA